MFVNTVNIVESNKQLLNLNILNTTGNIYVQK